MQEQQPDVNKDRKRKHLAKQNTPVPVSGGGGSSSSAGAGKLKRKDQHPVRKEFVQTSETQYKCIHCEWTTVLNATRMVKHIVDQCQHAPALVRDEIAAIQHATIEKERNSSFVVENKKDIHGLFQVRDNKRACMFCQWTTVRNLTRMRNHILSQCTEIPVKLKALFIKKEDYAEEASAEDSTEVVQQDNSESYQVYTLEDGRWDESGIEPMDYDCEDVEEPQLDDNYLEVQELEERNCSYCGKSLTYNSCEVETESEIFCSDQCLKRQEKTNQLTDQLASLEKSKRTAGSKRSMHEALEPEDEIPTKQIKFVVVSNSSSPQSTRMKQAVHARRTEVSNNTSTTVEIVDYTVEQDDSSSVPEEAPPSPKTPVRIIKKSPTKSVASPKKTPTPVRTSRPTPTVQSTPSAKVSGISDVSSK
ncbi:uncharacterized protein LOC135710536 [Ochlerotatus camptorhynchus]|uniref:uncharacterized protein LOC135710536 n=1 Tax=Ochlerotatus camptorhynchus TaxID=644619 RepID=UPI0031DF54E5